MEAGFAIRSAASPNSFAVSDLGKNSLPDNFGVRLTSDQRPTNSWFAPPFSRALCRSNADLSSPNNYQLQLTVFWQLLETSLVRKK
jgi:hypothetical protein